MIEHYLSSVFKLFQTFTPAADTENLLGIDLNSL